MLPCTPRRGHMCPAQVGAAVYPSFPSVGFGGPSMEGAGVRVASGCWRLSSHRPSMTAARALDGCSSPSARICQPTRCWLGSGWGPSGALSRWQGLRPPWGPVPSPMWPGLPHSPRRPQSCQTTPHTVLLLAQHKGPSWRDLVAPSEMGASGH